MVITAHVELSLMLVDCACWQADSVVEGDDEAREGRCGLGNM